MKDPNPPGSGKEKAEGKGVRREAESEGSRMWEQTNHGQTSGLTEVCAERAERRNHSRKAVLNTQKSAEAIVPWGNSREGRNQYTPE